MASMFPILFGAPSFGNEERDQWVRVLQLFLADPFAPHAVNVGGTTQVSYGWTVPAGAVVGGGGGIIDINSGTTGLLPWSRLSGVPSFWVNNNYGVRELNPFSTPTMISHGVAVSISDRPGLLFVFGETNNNFAMFMCGYDTFDNSGNIQVLASGDAADFSTLQDNADTFNCYFNNGEWIVQNNFPYCNKFYMTFLSLGQQTSQLGPLYSESFTGDGITDTFAVSNVPITSIYGTVDGVPIVFEDGSSPGIWDATVPEPGDVVIFDDPPVNGADIQLHYNSPG